MAQQVLTQFQEHTDSWTRVPDILEKSSYHQSKVGKIVSCRVARHNHQRTVYRSPNIRETDSDEVENPPGWTAARYVVQLLSFILKTN